jgi:hypothetical protein
MLKVSKNYFFPNQKNIVKENSEYLRIFHLLKISKIISFQIKNIL